MKKNDQINWLLNGFMPREDGYFKKGQVANPKGRPPKKTIAEMIEDYLEKNPDEKNGDMTQIIVSMMRKKDKEMIKEYWHQRDGMPKQAIEHTGEVDVNTILYLPNERNTPKNNNSSDKAN